MRNNLSQALQIFFSPQTIAPFLLGSVFLAVLGNAVYDLLKTWLGGETSGLLRIAFGALLLFALSVTVVYFIINQRLNRLQRTKLDIGKRPPHKFSGLILLVSNADPCRAAIRYHLPRLQRCWLICSLQTLDLARQMAREFPMVCATDPIIINDVYDPIEFRDAVNEVYRSRMPKSWLESAVIADYAGMTAHGSVGMVLACIGTNRALQYTPAHFDRATGKTLGSLDPIEVTLAWQASPTAPPPPSRAQR